MSPSPDILASSDEAIFKLVVLVIVLIVWGIGALASSLKGLKKQPSRRPPPLASAPPQSVMMIPRLSTSIAPQAPLPPLSSRAITPASRRLGPKAIPVAPALRAQRAPAAPPPSRPAPAPARPALGQLAMWLRPSTIRSQFVLSEILGKPLALRDRPRLTSPQSSGGEQYARLGSEA